MFKHAVNDDDVAHTRTRTRIRRAALPTTAAATPSRRRSRATVRRWSAD